MPAMKLTVTDRIAGCIIGGALGDALGGPYENKPFPVHLNPHAALNLSDDTQLTLATCEAIVAAQGPDPARIAAEFAVLFRQRRLRGLGASTFKALQELAAGAHWALVGSKGDRAAGNGPATRVAPLAFLLDPTDRAARQILRDISRITHHNEEAYCGALAVVTAVWLSFTGLWSGGSGLVREVCSMLPDSALRDRLRLMSFDFDQASLADLAREYGTSGYVVESVPFALMAAERLGELGFQPVIEEAIKVGGDTDSIASIVGQVCGACIGYRALPHNLLDRLPESAQVTATAKNFGIYIEHHAARAGR